MVLSRRSNSYPRRGSRLGNLPSAVMVSPTRNTERPLPAPRRWQCVVPKERHWTTPRTGLSGRDRGVPLPMAVRPAQRAIRLPLRMAPDPVPARVPQAAIPNPHGRAGASADVAADLSSATSVKPRGRAPLRRLREHPHRYRPPLRQAMARDGRAPPPIMMAAPMRRSISAPIIAGC